MAYTQEKNLITYQGRKYHFVFDLNTRKMTDGSILPKKIPTNDTCGKIVEFYSKEPQADGLMEAVIKNLDPIFNLDSDDLNRLEVRIESIKRKWKSFIHLDKTALGFFDLLEWLDLPFEMTELEFNFYDFCHIADKNVISKYAYQYAKYSSILSKSYFWNHYYEQLLMHENELVKLPSNLVDFLKLLLDKNYEYQHQDINAKLDFQYQHITQKYEGETEHFQIIVPQNVDMIRKEAEQQNNCVYDCYRDDIADGKTIVVFVRLKENIENSYITCEWRDGNIIQCYYKNNRSCLRTERDEINEYLAKIDGINI